MTSELISKRTRRAFQEHLVGWTLREITDLFSDENVRHVTLTVEQLPQGQRRSLVEEYYASVDWTDPLATRRILNVYEQILRTMSSAGDVAKSLFIQCLERDGYKVENNRIISKNLINDLAGVIQSTEVVNLEHLDAYLERIRSSIDTDPELAIGSTKELVEATLKTALDHLAIPYTNKDDIPNLLKKVQVGLELDPAGIEETRKASNTIRKILGSAGTIVVGVAELRNDYGSGHGRAKNSGIRPRHAKLAVGVGATLCTFILETLEERTRI